MYPVLLLRIQLFRAKFSKQLSLFSPTPNPASTTDTDGVAVAQQEADGACDTSWRWPCGRPRGGTSARLSKGKRRQRPGAATACGHLAAEPRALAAALASAERTHVRPGVTSRESGAVRRPGMQSSSAGMAQEGGAFGSTRGGGPGRAVAHL